MALNKKVNLDIDGDGKTDFNLDLKKLNIIFLKILVILNS